MATSQNQTLKADLSDAASKVLFRFIEHPRICCLEDSPSITNTLAMLARKGYIRCVHTIPLASVLPNQVRTAARVYGSCHYPYTRTKEVLTVYELTPTGQAMIQALKPHYPEFAYLWPAPSKP